MLGLVHTPGTLATNPSKIYPLPTAQRFSESHPEEIVGVGIVGHSTPVMPYDVDSLFARSGISMNGNDIYRPRSTPKTLLASSVLGIFHMKPRHLARVKLLPRGNPRPTRDSLPGLSAPGPHRDRTVAPRYSGECPGMPGGISPPMAGIAALRRPPE